MVFSGVCFLLSLNMVVGANGTGKSTILNAICLGLGGEPTILGRADDARDYVKHNCDRAEIEIELAPNPNQETHVLKRVIDRNRGSERGNGRGASTFYINDKKSNIKEVRKLVEEVYNISIENLCTFLPQDKVGKFSSITPQALLIETEKTLSGNQDFYNTHQDLINTEKELQESGGDVQSYQDKLKKLKYENEQLERAKDLLEEREAALAQADLLGKKKLWLEFDALRTRALELKEKKAEAKARFTEANEELAPLKEESENLQSQKKKLEARFKNEGTAIQTCQKALAKQKVKYNTHDDEIETDIAELAAIADRRDKLQAKVKEHQERVADLEGRDVPDLEEVEQEFQKNVKAHKLVYKDYTAAKIEERGLHENLRNLELKAKNAQGKVAKLEDDSSRRRERILRQHRDLDKVAQWIESNRGKFRRPVTGPVACEITPKNKNTAAFIEKSLPQWLLKAFIVETKEDYDLLYKSIRSQNINVNVVTIEGGRLQPLNSYYSKQKMDVLKKDYGMIGTMDEIFTAPDCVKQALISFGMVNKVLVGTDKTYQSKNKGLDEYLAEPDQSRNQHGKQQFSYFCSNGQSSHQYSGSVSKYGNRNLTTKEDYVNPAQMLAPGVDPTVIENAKSELNAIHQEMTAFRPSLQEAEQKKMQLEGQAQNMQAQKIAAEQRRKAVTSFMQKLDTAKAHLKESLKNLKKDDASDKKNLVNSIKNRIAASIAALEQQAEQQHKMIELTISSAGVEASKSALNVACRSLE
jgi:chromosome segregation ATPase